MMFYDYWKQENTIQNSFGGKNQDHETNQIKNTTSKPKQEPVVRAVHCKYTKYFKSIGQRYTSSNLDNWK